MQSHSANLSTSIATQIEQISKEAQSELSNAPDSQSLYQVKVRYLGKKGAITQLMKQLAGLPKEEKPLWGKKLNHLKVTIENQYTKQLTLKKEKEILETVSKDSFDLSLPGAKRVQGAFHPIEKIIQKTVNIFTRLGYSQVSDRLIETDWYNFSALNIPKEHPSRDNQDTFYLGEDYLLRTHTSSVQIRSLEKWKPPMAIISPGPVFRRDHPDSSHSPYFHQVEGLLIDRQISMSHLKGTLSCFLKELYGSAIKVRFRPSFFPFTEPSAEYDCSCFLCHQKGCSLCKKSGWIEMGGCGLVHPQVLKDSQVDPKKWQGFAFGMGMDRLALLEYGIPDIRFLYENRMDFLEQFENE